MAEKNLNFVCFAFAALSFEHTFASLSLCASAWRSHSSWISIMPPLPTERGTTTRDILLETWHVHPGQDHNAGSERIDIPAFFMSFADSILHNNRIVTFAIEARAK